MLTTVTARRVETTTTVPARIARSAASSYSVLGYLRHRSPSARELFGRQCRNLTACGFFAASLSLFAHESSSVQERDALQDKLRRAMPHLGDFSVDHSAAPGLFEVVVPQEGVLFYVTADGSHFVAGDLYAFGATGAPVNSSERRREAWRRELLSKIDHGEVLTFNGNGPPGHTLYAFVDVDCVFCRELHAALDAITSRGVDVHYLAFPREGVGSVSHGRMVSAWCSDDRVSAVDALMEGNSIRSVDCSNPVQSHFELGMKLGVEGTPTMFTVDGVRISGFRDVETLLTSLGVSTPP
ncbi:MAG: DsbC family protein [Gammaproteobacteria bacterium]|nr:DsbC family protein [Gammaproteobacteria bacterium]